MPKSADLALARVLAHCGGAPAAAVDHCARAIAHNPADPEPYAVLGELRETAAAEVATPHHLGQFVVAAYLNFLAGDMDLAAGRLGSVIGFQPEVAWASAPWFGDERFLAGVTAAGFADAGLNITDYGSGLTGDNRRPWLRVVDLLCEREPVPEAMARMAILLRFSGLIDDSLALCDRADAVRPVMLTEVVRGGTWRHLGDRTRTADAFRRALRLDPGNWSLHLDLADLAAEDGDYAAAVRLVDEGLELEPAEITLRAAGAAYRLRATGSTAAAGLLLELAPQLPLASYRHVLLGHALAAPGLPADRVAAIRALLPTAPEDGPTGD